jgi:cysteine synthase
LGFDWKSVVDEVVTVKRKPAFDAARKLCQWGIMAGPSTGMQYAGLIQYLKNLQRRGALCDVVERGANVVFVVCDTPLVYMNEF